MCIRDRLTRERDILVVPFYVSFDGETYLKEGVELDIREFYQRMVDHPDVFPKTSMPSVDDYYQDVYKRQNCGRERRKSEKPERIKSMLQGRLQMTCIWSNIMYHSLQGADLHLQAWFIVGTVERD